MQTRRTIRIILLVLFILLAIVCGLLGMFVPGWGSNVSLGFAVVSAILAAIPVLVPAPGSPPLLTLSKPVPSRAPQPSEEYANFRKQLEQENEPQGLGAIAVYGSQPLIGLDVRVKGPYGWLPTTYIAMRPGETEPIYAAVVNHLPPGDYDIFVTNMAQTVLQTIKTVQAGQVAEVYVQDRQPVFWRR